MDTAAKGDASKDIIVNLKEAGLILVNFPLDFIAELMSHLDDTLK